MTIFRSSFVLLGFLAVCGEASRGSQLPDPRTAIGKIFEIADFAQRASALEDYARKHLNDRDSLRGALLKAGFVESKMTDERGAICQRFDWTDHGSFPVVVLLNICGAQVFANAGQIAP